MSWPTLTASVAAIPAATLVIVLLPLSRPVPRNETVPFGPLMMVTPVLSSVVLPVVTEVRFKFAARSTFTLLPMLDTTTLLEPALTSTVAPGATFVVAPPLVDTFQPLLAVVATAFS